MCMFTYSDIENDSKFQEFLEKKQGRADTTKKSYIYALMGFCSFTGKSPSEIHDIHKNDLRERVPEFDMWLSEALDQYVAHLIDLNYSKNTIKTSLSKVRVFFTAFKLKPFPSTDIPINEVPEEIRYALDVEDIRKAIKNSPLVYQTLFITQAQTGLSVGDALLLDVKDFIDSVSKKGEQISIEVAIYRAKNERDIIGCFDLRRKKTGIQFYTFAGPETLKNIALLLESRDEEFLKPDCPIFMKDTSRLSEEHKNSLGLTPDNVHNFLTRMHNKKKIFPKIEIDGKERNYFRTHKLRKFFANVLKNEAQFPLEDVKYLMGQKTGDVSERYFNYNNYNTLKNNYRKALPFLAINDEIVMEENLEAIERLQKENRELKMELRKSQKHNQSEIEELKAELSNVQLETIQIVEKMFRTSPQSNLKLENLPSTNLKLLLNVVQKEIEKEKKN